MPAKKQRRRKRYLDVTPADEARIERALDAAGYPPVVTLRVVTSGPAEQTITCTGTPTCDCGPCAAERAALVQRGPQRAVRQPWESAA